MPAVLFMASISWKTPVVTAEVVARPSSCCEQEGGRRGKGLDSRWDHWTEPHRSAQQSVAGDNAGETHVESCLSAVCPHHHVQQNRQHITTELHTYPLQIHTSTQASFLPHSRPASLASVNQDAWMHTRTHTLHTLSTKDNEQDVE